MKTTLQYRHTMYFVEQVSDQHFLKMLWPPSAGVKIPCLGNLTKISVILVRRCQLPHLATLRYHRNIFMFRSCWNVFGTVRKSSYFFGNSKLLKRQKLEHVIRYTNSSAFVKLCVTNNGLVSKIRKTKGPWGDKKNKVHK